MRATAHAVERCWERYEIDLRPADLERIGAQIEGGSAQRLGDNDRHPGTEAWRVQCRDRVAVVSVDADHEVILTFREAAHQVALPEREHRKGKRVHLNKRARRRAGLAKR